MISYKTAFWLLLIFTCLVVFPSLYHIHKRLDQVDQYVLDDQISKYVDAGWMPYELKSKKKNTPKHKKSKKKETK